MKETSIKRLNGDILTWDVVDKVPEYTDLKCVPQVLVSDIKLEYKMYLEQGSQTRGPPDVFVRIANISKTDKIIVFDRII